MLNINTFTVDQNSCNTNTIRYNNKKTLYNRIARPKKDSCISCFDSCRVKIFEDTRLVADIRFLEFYMTGDALDFLVSDKDQLNTIKHKKIDGGGYRFKFRDNKEYKILVR